MASNKTSPTGPSVRATRRRSLAKTVSWRLVATADTFVISYFITGSLALAGSIISIEVVTKLGLYYVHERGWNRVPWARGAIAKAG